LRIMLSLIVGALACTAAFAADLNAGKVVFTSGDWVVLQTPDLMTGKKGCTGLYRAPPYKVALTDDGLFISQAANGGLKGYSVRFDDEPASGDRTASPFERDIQSIALKHDDYAKALASKRLRIHIVTAGDRLADEDIDLTAIGSVHQAIVSGKGCH
jgi:hypothetical protein